LVAVSFLLLVLGPVHAQRCHEMDSCWLDQFAPWHRAWIVPWWAFFSTLDVARYCLEPWGQFLVVPALVGAVSWWRTGRREQVILLAAPVALALLAACLRAYPYGGARVVVYAAPALTLLTAPGIPPLFAWLSSRARWLLVVPAVVLLAPLALALYHLAVPWDRADTAAATAHVLAHRRPADQVAGNQWEPLYYFHDLGPATQMRAEVPAGSGELLWLSLWDKNNAAAPAILGGAERLWLVAIGKTVAERRRVLQAVPPAAWRAIEQTDFTYATVYLLARKRPGDTR
jgi:hypothetical protein